MRNVGYTRAAHQRAEKIVNRQFLKQSEVEWHAFEQLKKQTDHVTLKNQTDLANLTMLLKFAAHLLKSKCNYLYYSIIFSYLRKIKYRTGILQN